MPDERSSPSAGWRAVYDAMAVSPDLEADSRDCPDCGEESPRIRPGVFWCHDHGRFDVAETVG